jgi:hypothetical protein
MVARWRTLALPRLSLLPETMGDVRFIHIKVGAPGRPTCCLLLSGNIFEVNLCTKKTLTNRIACIKQKSFVCT